MKKALLAVSVLSLVVVGLTAQAAKTDKVTKKSKKISQYLLTSNSAAASAATAVVAPKKSKANAKVPAVVAVKEEVLTKATPAEPVAAMGVTTLTTAVKPVEKKFTPGLKFNWTSINSIPQKTVQNFQKNEKDELDQEVFAWEVPNLGYQFTKTSSFSIIPQFFHTWFGTVNRVQNSAVKAGELKQSGSFFMGDIGLSLKQKELVKVGETTISGSLKYDLPTSEMSQAANTPGSVWGIIDVARSVGKWDFTLNLWTRFYFQNYLTSTLHDEKDQTLQNPMFRDYVIGNVGYNFTKKLSATLGLGTKDTISYGDDAGRAIKYSNMRLTDLSVSYAFSPGFNLSLGLSEELSMRGQKVPFNIPFDAGNEAGGGDVYLQAVMSI